MKRISSIENTYEEIENLEIGLEGVFLKNKAIKNINLPSRDELLQTKSIQFEECIFLNEYDLNFYEFNSKIHFHKCIFVKDVILFGYFNNTVSFEGSTFIDSKVSFQECSFQHFVFNLVTLNNCNVDFQETTFYSNNIFFGNLCLLKSSLLFNGSFFPKNADLLDLITIEADENSKILFNMVDFNFREVRLFRSDIKHLEFLDCTFECNRFDFDCSCETLVMQDCKNFRIISFNNLEGIKHLNIYNFINIGKILLNQEPYYFINAINSNKKIIWVRGREYKSPSNEEIKNQIFSLMEFYSISQQHYKDQLKTEINDMNKNVIQSNNSMKVFLSYSWKDESIADCVEKEFVNKGVAVVRDIRDLPYKSSIKNFMKQIRKHDYSCLIISEDYLKSSNCMYEIGEFTKDENYTDRILPIIKKGTNIFNPSGRIDYIVYWQDKYKELESQANKLENLSRSDANRELSKLEKIKLDLPDFLGYLSDVNMLTFDGEISKNDFEKIWHEIQKSSY